jgi:hypothetical protein
VSEEAEDAGQQSYEGDILEVHSQYNLQSKKAEGISSKRTPETPKVFETGKGLEKSTAGKSPEKSRTDTPVKKDITILKRPHSLKFHLLICLVLLTGGYGAPTRVNESDPNFCAF